MNRLLLVLLILAIPLSVAATDQYGAAAYRQLKFLLTDLSCSAPGTCDLASGTTIGGAAIGSGGGVSDGDKGDVTVSGSGAAWAVDSGAVDFSELAGSATDGQIPNTITVDLATVATTANAGDSATAFFSSGTIEDARIDGSAESDEVTGLTDGQISDTLTASTSTTAAANDSDTSIATTAFVQQEIDDGDFLTDNCTLENDGTPIPDSCVGDGTDGGGGNQSVTLGPFYINDLAGTATTQATLGFFNTATALSRNANADVKIQAAAHVVGLFITSDAARTAGTATARVRIAGSGTTFNGGAVVLNATDTQSDSSLVAHASGLAVTAGQTVGCDVVTSGWTPITADIACWIVVSYD